MKILSELKNHARISTEKILEYIGEEIDENMTNPLVRSYWLGRCQLLMSSIRDSMGYRMVFNVPEKNSRNKCSEYVVVAADANMTELEAIGFRMRNNINGLEHSIAVIDDRYREVEDAHKCIDFAMRKRVE